MSQKGYPLENNLLLAMLGKYLEHVDHLQLDCFYHPLSQRHLQSCLARQQFL
jgi:hypothetical protein